MEGGRLKDEGRRYFNNLLCRILIIVSFFLFNFNLYSLQLHFKNHKKQIFANFLIKNLSLYDKINFKKEIFIENIEYAFLARYLMPWGKIIPDDIFKKYVLPHRVSQEPPERWRKIFFEELGEKVYSMKMIDAVIFISKWCYIKSYFKPSYPWDSGPIDVINLGWGRCEEKAILLIDALRSVSIPARLVFTPGWMHANGNHAWVEVWINGKWHVLEIAKPVIKLDHPWFRANYSVMPTVYTYIYGEGYKNIIENYNSNICTIWTKSKEKMYLSIFNSGMLRIVGAIKQNKIKVTKGTYLLTGYGFSKLINCNKILKMFKTKDIDKISLIFKYPSPEKIKKEKVYDLSLIRKIDKKRKSIEAKIRKKVEKNISNLNIKNRKELIDKLLTLHSKLDKFIILIKNLNELFKSWFIKDILNIADKDLVRISPTELLEDIKIALKTKKNNYEDKIFLNYVLNPRIYFENIRLWREFILKNTNFDKSNIIESAKNFIYRLEKIDKKDAGPMLGPFEVIKSKKYRSKIEALITLCAILRSYGIPARFDISSHYVEIYKNNKWVFLKTKFNDFNRLKKVKICWKDFYKKCPGKLEYDRDFTISEFKNGYFKAIRFLDGRYYNNSCCWEGERIPGKKYFLINGKRIKNKIKVNIFKLNLH